MWRDSDIVGDSLNLMIMIVFILINTISTYDVSIYIFLEGVFFFLMRNTWILLIIRT